MTRRGFTSLLSARPTRPAPSRAAAGTLRGRSACPASLGFGVDVGEIDFDVLAQNGTRPQRITSKLRSPALASWRRSGGGRLAPPSNWARCFGVVILAGPQRAAHVSTEALPRGRTRSLRSSNQLMAPMAPTARNSRMPASFRTPMKISTAIAVRNARTGLSTAAAIIDQMAQVGRLLHPSQPMSLCLLI
jgi:hypothetical protein